MVFSQNNFYKYGMLFNKKSTIFAFSHNICVFALILDLLENTMLYILDEVLQSLFILINISILSYNNS